VHCAQKNHVDKKDAISSPDCISKAASYHRTNDHISNGRFTLRLLAPGLCIFFCVIVVGQNKAEVKIFFFAIDETILPKKHHYHDARGTGGTDAGGSAPARRGHASFGYSIFIRAICYAWTSKRIRRVCQDHDFLDSKRTRIINRK